MEFLSKLETNSEDSLSPRIPEEILMNVHDVDFSYLSNQPVLDKISFDIHVGEIIAIIGPSRSGKSTLIKLLSGLFIQQNGIVEYLGKELLSASSFKEEVGFTFDKPCLFRKKTVLQNLNYYKRLYKDEINIHSILVDFHFEGFKDVLVENLSHEGQIIVNIMRTLINKPKIILIDHMFSALNPDSVNLIFEMLLKYKQNGSTIVLNDSSINPSIKIADRILFLKNGKIFSVLTKNEFINKYPLDSVVLTYKEHELFYKKLFSLPEVRTSDFLHFLEDKEIFSFDSISSKADEIYSIETGDDLNV
jgi:ABC-type multidrug transport system ATPase subunit